MTIKVLKVPCEVKDGEFTMSEELATEMENKRETIDSNVEDSLKLLSQIAQYNAEQISQSKKIEGKSFIFKKIISS